MKTHDCAEIISRALLTIVVLALTLTVLWFISLPEQEYEPVPNQIEGVAVSDRIDTTGIYQTFRSNGKLRGIRVRWATSRTVPADGVIADLFDWKGRRFLERIIIPAADIRDNQETDVVFSGTFDPGEYVVMFTSLPESSDRISVWESANDDYKDGEAYNSKGEAEGRDWKFNLLTALPGSALVRHQVQRIVYSALVLTTGAGALVWIYAGTQLKKRKGIASAVRFVRGHADHLLIALLVLIPTLVYMDFLTGDRLYVFTMLDRGADSVGQTYPGLLDTAARIRNGQWGEIFNFRLGLGDAQSAFFPNLTNWVVLFGEGPVARLMAVSQWAKVVLSGLFAYLFVREYGAGTAARFVIALGYAFNSMLIARGAWESYPNISVLAILWLYAYERKLNGKGILLSLFATLFMFVNLGLYDCVFYAVLLPGYMLVRRITKEDTGAKAFRAFLADFGLFAVFAVLGMMDTVRYLLARTLGSSRLQEGMDSYEETVGSGIFSAPEIWMSAFLRTIGHSVSGITWQTGSLNLLEGPAFYTGIAAVLVVPAALWCMKGKKKVIYLLLLFCAVCYVSVVPLRLVANGFAKETFKLSSFWITILLLLLSVDFFRSADRKETGRSAVVVTGIFALIVISLLVLAGTAGYVVSVNEWWISLVFVILYLILTGLFFSGRRTAFVRFLVILCAVAEAATVPFEMINNRSVENADENSLKERASTREIIDSLPDEEWYRLEKDYVNVYQSDALAEGYRGISSYLGGIEINQSVLDIYRTFSLPQRGNHYLFGSGANTLLESVASVRYILSKDNMAIRYGYRLTEIRNGIRIYENQYAHPLFYLTTEPVSPGELRGEYALSDQVGYELKDGIFYFGRLKEGTVLILEAEFDHESRSTVYLQDREGQYAKFYFMGSRNMVFEIANPDVYSLWFDRYTNRHLKNFSFYLVDQETYYRRYVEYSLAAQQNTVPYQVINENRFSGTTAAEEDAYLMTAIPYDRKWKVLLDGEEQATSTVSGGFLAAKIPAGEHRLEVFYDGDSWFRGNIFKLAGLGAFILAAIVVILKRRPGEEM